MLPVAETLAFFSIQIILSFWQRAALLTHGPSTKEDWLEVHMNEEVIDTVQTLCREGNRDSVLTAFQNFPEHFSCIPLNDSNVESKQAINDLLRENVSSASALSVPTLLKSAPHDFADPPDHLDRCVEVLA